MAAGTFAPATTECIGSCAGVRLHVDPSGVSMSFFSTQSKPVADAKPAPLTGPLISMRNLEKVFETPAGRMFVLRRITAEVQPGEFISIMGPSGAGKSTLLAILGMLDSA